MTTHTSRNESFYFNAKDVTIQRNNNNTKMFDKSDSCYPSFLPYEPIPQKKIVENCIDGSKFVEEVPSSVLELSQCIESNDNVSATLISTNKVSEVATSSVISKSMPPPLNQKNVDALKPKLSSKIQKKKTTGMAAKGKPTQARYSCPDCDLEVVFRSKMDLQHHLAALHTLVECKYCQTNIQGLVKLRQHHQAVHQLNKVVQKDSTGNPVRSQTYHVCGQCEYKTNQASNLIRHRESLHAYYTCTYCYPDSESFLGKKRLSEHLKQHHKLRINLKTYFEDEKKIHHALKVGSGKVPQLKCHHCGFITNQIPAWTKHDCNIIKVNKLSTEYSAVSCPSIHSEDSVGVPADLDTGDDDHISMRSQSPSTSGAMTDFASAPVSPIPFEDDTAGGPVSEADIYKADSAFERVPDFRAVNEFFEFRLYDVRSSGEMLRIWDEALSKIFLKRDFVTQAFSVNENLALWEM